jgi:hypothetical protein
MTRVATDRAGESSGSEPPRAAAVAPPQTPPSASPEGSAPAADPTKGKDHHVVPSGADVLASPDGCQRPAPQGPAPAAAAVSEAVASWPAPFPAEVEGIVAHEVRLARAARESLPALPPADAVAAVEAGMLADAVDLATSRTVNAVTGDQERSSTPGEDSGAQPVGRGITVAAELGQAAAAVQRHGLPPAVAAAVDWSPFGQVIPVLSGSPGAGASVFTAAISDVLQLAARCVLVVDTADPVRSGLAQASRSEGPWGPGPHPAVRIRYAWRAQAVLARAETSLPALTPGMVPPPRFWRPAVRELHATVVDLGHDAWRVSAHPLIGAGEWLRRGTPLSRPVLVVRPTRRVVNEAALSRKRRRFRRWRG